MVFVVEVVVDLNDAVVAITGSGDGRKIVVRICRKSRNAAGPKCCKEGCGKRTPRNAVFCQRCLGLIRPGCRWFRGFSCQTKNVVLLFIAGEKESPALDNRATDGKSIVLIAQRRSLRELRRGNKEGRLCRVEFIPIVVI